MTKSEFDNYVASFNKVRGQYTKEEIILIGLKHKEELEKTEKNWRELANTLGWFGSGESLRCFIKRNSCQQDSYKFGSNEELETQQNRDYWNAYRRFLREEARVEQFKQTFVDTAKSMKPIKLKVCENVGDSGVEAILMLSDWHIGQDCKNFYNTYDFNTAVYRISKLISNVKKECSDNKVNTLHILNLGDLIEGVINTSARLEQEFDVVNQLFKASELLANALAELQGVAENVTYRSVVDNHSRYFKDYNQHIAKENMNKIIDWWIEERLKDSSIKFIHDNLDDGLGRFKTDNGVTVAFFHGHEGSKDKTLQELVGAIKEWTDIACCGHWHNSAEHTYQGMKLFVNGSICGTGTYALSKRLFTQPTQKLIILKKTSICDLDIRID